MGWSRSDETVKIYGQVLRDRQHPQYFLDRRHHQQRVRESKPTDCRFAQDYAVRVSELPSRPPDSRDRDYVGPQRA
jgi:hypothetical protein